MFGDKRVHSILLSPPEAQLFFKLHRALMFFREPVEASRLAPRNQNSQRLSAAQAPQARIKVHKAFLDDIDIIEKFIDENPAHLTDDELEIVDSWHHLVSGTNGT